MRWRDSRPIWKHLTGGFLYAQVVVLVSIMALSFVCAIIGLTIKAMENPAQFFAGIGIAIIIVCVISICGILFE